jgi:hypothetical protein
MKLKTKAIIVVVALVALAVAWLIVAFTWYQGVFVSQDDVVAAVEKQAYSDVVVDDKDIFFVNFWGGECGEMDDALFEITATNALGNRVEIIACAGWPWKGVTIRTQ